MLTLGVLIGVPVAALGVLICLVGAVLLFRGARDAGYDRGLFYAMGIACVAALLAIVIGTGFALWPWQGQYHRWTPVDGKVVTVSSRLLPGASSGTEQKFVVVLDSHPGQPYAIQDTRAALLKVGDTVSLRCKRAYQYQADSGWDCRWNGGTPTGGGQS